MNIEINTDNNLLQNRTKSTNCDGLSVSKKIDLFERYLKENSNESIHSNTIFEGYNIGRILIQLRYLMKNNLIKYNSEEFKRMENLGLLENTKETIYVKIKRLKQFCEKHPYAFSNIYRLRKDLNKKEKMEFEKVFKDYTYIRERKSRGKLPQKLEEELNNSQIGGVFKKEDIGELYEKYEIGDKEKRQIINEFGNMENLKKSYKKYMIKLANAKNYNEIHRIKIENKESAMENPKIPLVRNFYLGSQSLEKQKALLNFISYMYGEKYATNIILGPEVDVILEKILREMLTDRERHIVEFKFGLKREEEIPKEVRNMKQQSMYQIMCYQVVRKMRKKEIKDVFLNHLYKPSEEFIRAYFSKRDVFEKDSEQLSDGDKQELLNMIDVENENIGVIDEDTIEEMAIENINFSTQLLYKAMKYNGVNTVGDLLEKARSKKDLLTMAYIGNKEAEEIIEKLSELGITIYNGVKTREKIGLEIKSLNLSHRSYMVLARNEIHTVEQLVERIKSKDDLLQLRLIGETTAYEIIEKLAENGITIYKDETEEAIKIALSKLRIQQEKMQELDANIHY
ncbi:MAG: DNA-directed RNA polymerase subunit alpha C-terminal domain-containing protein, partial [Clostridia bacterium]|nr:DNA-directed RNA polymerase subunit alpha C-terminal domain-containing protein [Clostridia bacterium]